MADQFTILTAVLVAIGAWYFLFPTPPKTVQLATTLSDTYDYIVVGAGSAGCVVASRLSEDPDVSVLLVEAGGYDLDDPITQKPAYAGVRAFTHMDWGYWTEPQKNAQLGFFEQRGYWARGKGLGGSALLNYMAWVRGSRYDFDGWAELGATGWSYDEILPYYRKLEDIQVDELKNSPYHSTGGLLKVSETDDTPLQDVFLKSGEEMGYRSKDCNGEDGDQEAFCPLQSSTGGGLRWSTAWGYIRPFIDRPNLDVALYSHVTKLVIANKRAVAVTMIRNGKKETIKARREIIMSAGAINTPQILMLSGIGPKKHLESMKIPVIADLPVGENLQDHMFVLHSVDIDKNWGITPAKMESYWSELRFYLFGTGPLSLAGLCEGHAFVRTDPEPAGKSPGDKAPDVEFHLLSAQMQDFPGHLFIDPAIPNVRKEIWPYPNETIRTPTGYGFTIINIAPAHPKSTGTVRLASSDPFDYPLMDPHYLEHPDDVKTLMRGLRLVQRMIATKPFKAIGARVPLAEKHFSLCKDKKLDSDPYWECVTRHMAQTVYHYSGTCKMGQASDPTTVLDPQLRVKGIKGLRVADASVMPFVISGNTNAPTIVVAEKASDLIKGIDSVKKYKKKRS